MGPIDETKAAFKGSTSLEDLIINGCMELTCLPEGVLQPTLLKIDIRRCLKLKTLNPFDKSEAAFNGLMSLQQLVIYDCPELITLPAWVLQPTLVKIDIQGCPKLKMLNPIDKIVAAFNGLTSLRQLCIYDCPELVLPAFKGSTSLEELIISGCTELTCLPEGVLQPTLREIDIRQCPKLKTLSPFDESEAAFNGLTSLQHLVIFDCPELITLPAWVLQPTLIEIDIRQCPKLKTLNAIDESEAAFNNSASLQQLVIYDCPELITFPAWMLQPPLIEIDIRRCPKLKALNPFDELEAAFIGSSSLQKLEIYDCPELITLPDSPPESMPTEHEGVMSVPGVEASTTVSSESGHQLAEIAINLKEGKWNESGQIDEPIMSITTSTEGLLNLELFILPPARSSEKTVMHKIIEDGPFLSFSLRESDYSVISRKNLEEQNGTNIAFPKHYVLAICNAELREPPAEEKWWRPSLILLTKNKLSSLPEKPNCRNLQGLFLQNNALLRRIPSSFFDNMPKLQFLDMSKIGVRKLPASLSKLSELKALFLRDCDNIDELPVGIGNLERIEVLDLWGTQLLNLPDEIAKLSHLRLLRVSFYGADEDSEYPKLPLVLVSPCIISQLCTLQALSIAVRPGDGRWNKSADSITDDVASLGELTYLQFYFPEVKFLALFMQKSPSWKDGRLRKFKFILGQDIERVVSRVPDDVISEYEKHDRCLRYVNGDEKIPEELEKLLIRITAFYLDHHCTVKSLSEFGLTNLEELKFCVLRECPNIVNIINNVQKTEGLLPHLEHLSMHYLPRLEKIWKGVVPLGSLDRLKLLSVRKCPKLKFILTESMLQCLSNLEELIVEDCESVKVIIETKGKRVKAGTILPSLKKMKLSYLPKLGMLWNGADPTFELIVRGCPLFKSST